MFTKTEHGEKILWCLLEDDARILANEFGDMFKLVWKIDIRDYEGKFFYMADAKGYYEKWDDLFVLIENAPAPANCKIVQKTKRVKYFEKLCSQE